MPDTPDENGFLNATYKGTRVELLPNWMLNDAFRDSGVNLHLWTNKARQEGRPQVTPEMRVAAAIRLAIVNELQHREALAKQKEDA